MHLLDVSVLVALGDDAHEFHHETSRWFVTVRTDGWATCPITENALVRILGHSGYPGGPGSPAKARLIMQALIRTPGHVFWADEISLLDSAAFPSLAGTTSASLTDLYLLGLAIHHGARFATLDRRIDPTALPGGSASLVMVPVS